MKKQLSLALAATLVLSGAAFAEADVQAQLDEANQRIEELEGLVAKYEPYYYKSIAATWGENGVVDADVVLAEYNQMANYYAQYGIDPAAYGLADGMKMEILEDHVIQEIELEKAAELGLDVLSEETVAQIEADADAQLNYYITSYTNYFYPDQDVTEEMIAEATEYWVTNGITREAMVEQATRDAILTAVESSITADITVTEEDISAAYEELIAESEAYYTESPANFVSDYCSGSTIAWVPEGHRAVKQVLIKFDDDQAARYSDLSTKKSDLETELAAATAEDAPADARSIDEINADIAAVDAEIESLYAELMPKANEVVEAFNNGTPIETLIAEYNDDPGMTTEPTATTGYAVAADSLNWDPAFTSAAMSIENPGEISEPTYGSYGIYIVYYMNDIPAGPVSLESIHDELAESTLSTKRATALSEQQQAWLEEANVTYYYANLGIATTSEN